MNFLGIMLCIIIAGIGTLIGFFWNRRIDEKNKVVTKVLEEKQYIELEEQPRPTRRNVMVSITVINNKTDKEYVIESENDFGLTWSYSESVKEKPNYSILRINQQHNDSAHSWTAISRFLDFSVKSTVWKEFDIVYDDKKEVI